MRHQRSVFFLLAAAAAAAMIPVAEQKFRWVAVVVTTAYLVYAVASFFDARLRFRNRR